MKRGPRKASPGNKAPLRLVTNPEQASAGTIEALENMLKLAKSGEITQVAIAATDKEGYSHIAYSAKENFGLLVGSVERLKYNLLAHQDST